MEDRARDGPIGPAGEARPLQPGDAAFVVAGQTEDGLEVRHGPPSISMTIRSPRRTRSIRALSWFFASVILARFTRL